MRVFLAVDLLFFSIPHVLLITLIASILYVIDHSMISDFFLPVVGGVEGHIYSLSVELMRRGHRVSVGYSIALFRNSMLKSGHCNNAPPPYPPRHPAHIPLATSKSLLPPHPPNRFKRDSPAIPPIFTILSIHHSPRTNRSCPWPWYALGPSTRGNLPFLPPQCAKCIYRP